MSVQSVVSLVMEGEDKGFTDVLGTADSGLNSVIDSVATLGTIGIAAGAIIAVGSALSDMADMAGEADSALSDLQIRTGLAEGELAGMRETIFDIRESGLGESFANVAEEMGTVQAITKATGDDLRLMTENALVLADVMDYDVKESTRAADTAMENFKITGQEAFDLIIAGYQRTGDPADDLLDTVNEYSADFAEAGFQAEEFFGILAAGADAGAFNLDKVADSVREFTTRIVDGSTTTRNALDDIGIGADNLYAQFQDGSLSVADSLGLVIGALRGLEDPIAQDAAGVALFGSLWEDLGSSLILSLDQGTEALGNYQGAAQEAFDVATSGLQNTQAQAEAAKEQYQLLIGEAILPLKLEYYELANAILQATIDRREESEAIESQYTAGADLVSQLEEQATALGSLSTVQNDVADGYYGAQEAVLAINDAFDPLSGNIETAERNTRALQIANDLLAGGFTGTGQALGLYAVELVQANDAAGTFNETNKDLDFQTGLLLESNGLLVDSLADVTDGNEDAAASADRNAAASDRAALMAERAAEAEAYRTEQVQLANAAVAGLNDTMARGFDQSLGILEQGGQLASLNDVIYETGAEAGLSAIELATMKVAMGEASEQAIADAIKFEIIKQSIVNLTAAAQEDGQVTRDEIGNIISAANDLKLELDERFAFEFKQKGIDSVLADAQNMIGELETAAASPYEIQIDANTENLETAVSTALTKADELTATDQVAAFFANTDDADKGISKVRTDIDDLIAPIYELQLDADTTEAEGKAYALEDRVLAFVEPTYEVKMDSNALETQDDVNNLRAAAEALNGKTYRFRIEADTSGVPPWAIPHSPLPIHTAWLDFAADMERLAINPTINGQTSTANGGGLLPNAGLGSAEPAQLIIYGDVVMSRDDANSRLLMAFLENQLRLAER